MGQLWEGKIAFKISKKSWKNKPSCSSKNSTHCIKFSQKTEFPKICIYIWCSLARFRKNSSCMCMTSARAYICLQMHAYISQSEQYKNPSYGSVLSNCDFKSDT